MGFGPQLFLIGSTNLGLYRVLGPKGANYFRLTKSPKGTIEDQKTIRPARELFGNPSFSNPRGEIWVIESQGGTGFWPRNPFELPKFPGPFIAKAGNFPFGRRGLCTTKGCFPVGGTTFFGPKLRVYFFNQSENFPGPFFHPGKGFPNAGDVQLFSLEGPGKPLFLGAPGNAGNEQTGGSFLGEGAPRL